MAPWFWYAVLAAVLYGAHQIFTRLAAERIGEGLGGFIVEASAALSISIYLAILWFAGRSTQKFSEPVSLTRWLPEFASELARSRSFSFFKKAGRFLLFQQFWLAARRSWPSREFFFSVNHYHGKESSALRLRSLVCFCCGNRIRNESSELFDLITANFRLL